MFVAKLDVVFDLQFPILEHLTRETSPPLTDLSVQVRERGDVSGKKESLPFREAVQRQARIPTRSAMLIQKHDIWMRNVKDPAHMAARPKNAVEVPKGAVRR